MIQDFVNEVLLALKDDHDAMVASLAKGVGILDYAQYREQVGEIRGYEQAAEKLRDIATRWRSA